jgi:hypothetical protein
MSSTFTHHSDPDDSDDDEYYNTDHVEIDNRDRLDNDDLNDDNEEFPMPQFHTGPEETGSPREHATSTVPYVWDIPSPDSASELENENQNPIPQYHLGTEGTGSLREHVTPTAPLREMASADLVSEMAELKALVLLLSKQIEKHHEPASQVQPPSTGMPLDTRVMRIEKPIDNTPMGSLSIHGKQTVVSPQRGGRSAALSGEATKIEQPHEPAYPVQPPSTGMPLVTRGARNEKPLDNTQGSLSNHGKQPAAPPHQAGVMQISPETTLHVKSTRITKEEKYHTPRGSDSIDHDRSQRGSRAPSWHDKSVVIQGPTRNTPDPISDHRGSMSDLRQSSRLRDPAYMVDKISARQASINKGKGK